MRVRVLLFATLAEQLGAPHVEVDLPEGATVGQMLSRLGAEHPDLASARASLAVAVNHAYVDERHRLSATDEIALIPPISGG